MKLTTISCTFVLLASFFSFAAQPAKSPAGHWEGSINVPSMELKVSIDLAVGSEGLWIGDIDIPAQGAADLPLKDIAVAGTTVSFALPAGPGNPRFQGKVSDDGTSISGDFLQGGNSFPFTLKRTGEASVTIPKRNAALPAAFVGKWEGSLETPGGKLRLAFNLDNKSGAAAGTIDSLDQGAMGIPMDEISTTGGSILISVRAVGGKFAGKLDTEGRTLAGDWTQGGATLPLVLSRGASKN